MIGNADEHIVDWSGERSSDTSKCGIAMNVEPRHVDQRRTKKCICPGVLPDFTRPGILISPIHDGDFMFGVPGGLVSHNGRYLDGCEDVRREILERRVWLEWDIQGCNVLWDWISPKEMNGAFVLKVEIWLPRKLEVLCTVISVGVCKQSTYYWHRARIESRFLDSALAPLRCTATTRLGRELPQSYLTTKSTVTFNLTLRGWLFS